MVHFFSTHFWKMFYCQVRQFTILAMLIPMIMAVVHMIIRCFSFGGLSNIILVSWVFKITTDFSSFSLGSLGNFLPRVEFPFQGVHFLFYLFVACWAESDDF